MLALVGSGEYLPAIDPDEFPGTFSRVMRLFSDQSLTMVGIDGRTALVSQNGRYEVLGRGQVTLFLKDGPQKFEPGLLPDVALT